MQRSRRHDPYPWTWEVPLGITFAVVMLLLLAAHVGRAAANVLAGQPWRFPPRTELFSSLPDLLRGDATAGLQALPALPPGEGAGAAPGLLWTCMALSEVVALTLVLVLAVQGLRRWGPGRVKGMASPSEVERLLGRSRLRRHRAVVRPDLYGRRGRAESLHARVDR